MKHVTFARPLDSPNFLYIFGLAFEKILALQLAFLDMYPLKITLKKYIVCLNLVAGWWLNQPF